MPADFRGLIAACTNSLDELEGKLDQASSDSQAGRVTLKDGRVANVFVVTRIDEKKSKKSKPAPEEETVPTIRRRRGRRKK